MEVNKRVEKVIDFLKKEFPDGIQMFNTRNMVGDFLYPIYEEDGISIDYCRSWDYIEIFGLKAEEFDTVLHSGKGDPFLGTVRWE